MFCSPMLCPADYVHDADGNHIYDGASDRTEITPRSTVNVTGDLAAAVVVARGEEAHPNPEPG
jgi:hypothetical protein